jgi:hypothetical protein
MLTLTGELIIALSSIFCTGVGSILIYVYRIKCNKLQLCCFTCSRDVDGENQGYQLEHPLGETTDIIPSPSPRSPSSSPVSRSPRSSPRSRSPRRSPRIKRSPRSRSRSPIQT